MTTVNGNFLKFPGVYLFQEIAHQVAAFKKTAPEKRVISLGIGDVTQPLAPAVIRATSPSNQISAPVSTGYSIRAWKYGTSPAATPRNPQNGTASL